MFPPNGKRSENETPQRGGKHNSTLIHEKMPTLLRTVPSSTFPEAWRICSHVFAFKYPSSAPSIICVISRGTVEESSTHTLPAFLRASIRAHRFFSILFSIAGTVHINNYDITLIPALPFQTNESGTQKNPAHRQPPPVSPSIPTSPHRFLAITRTKVLRSISARHTSPRRQPLPTMRAHPIPYTDSAQRKWYDRHIVLL